MRLPTGARSLKSPIIVMFNDENSVSLDVYKKFLLFYFCFLFTTIIALFLLSKEIKGL
jgi:hypothetical protein